MNGCIYIHVNKTNGKVYVGQTRNTKERWRSGYKQQPYFRKALVKYGWGGFDHLVVIDSVTDQDKLNNLEKLWVILLRSTNRDCGYNLVPGGFSGSSELGRLGGIASNLNPKNRYRLSKLSTSETCSRGGILGGQKNVETGQIIALGHKQGKKNKESGHWDRIKILGNVFDTKWGHEQGLRNIENGHMKVLSAQGKINADTPGYMSNLGKLGGKKGGPAVCHLRWHVRRNIVNPNCPLCVKNIK
jgi:hypothetical protein